jgi:hypothetical protein
MAGVFLVILILGVLAGTGAGVGSRDPLSIVPAAPAWESMPDDQEKWKAYLRVRCAEQPELPYEKMVLVAKAESDWNRYKVEFSEAGNEISFSYFQAGLETARDYRAFMGLKRAPGESEKEWLMKPKNNVDVACWGFRRSLYRHRGDFRQALMDWCMGPAAAGEFKRNHGHLFFPYDRQVPARVELFRRVLWSPKVEMGW